MSNTLVKFMATLGVVGLCATTLIAADEAPNPVPNASFEDSLQNWVVDDSISKIDPGAAHTGKLGLRIASDHYAPTGSSVTSVRFPIAAEQEITISFSAKATADCSAVYVNYFTPAGKRMQGGLPKGTPTDCPIRKSDDWKAYSLTTKAPAGAGFVSLWVHSYSGGIGTIDLDDFSIAGLAPGVAWVASPIPRKAAAPADPVKLPPRQHPPIIVLKLDDLKQIRGKINPNWSTLADLFEARHIKASFGMICDTLPEAAPEYVAWVKKLHESGQIEFWFHGWDHADHEADGGKFAEFTHRSYEEQKKHFDDAQAVAQDKFGFAFTTFGPPGGGFDDSTVRVMADDPHMSCWLYPTPIDEPGKKLQAAGKVAILDRVFAVNLESAVGAPDFKFFVSGYQANPQRTYFVLQGHPAMWNADKIAEFTKIIDYLTEQKAVFMTPMECAAAVAHAAPEK